MPECMEENTPNVAASLEQPQNEVMVFDMSAKPTKGKKASPRGGNGAKPAGRPSERNPPAFNDRV